MFSKIITVATALAFVAQGVVGEDCIRTYTVKEGDYCDSISRNNEVSTYQLLALNHEKFNDYCTDLQPETVLCLGRIESEDCRETYTVKKDDTCAGVAAAYGVDLAVLYENNIQLKPECKFMYIGEVICVAKEHKAPPSDGFSLAPTGPAVDKTGDLTLPAPTTVPPTTPNPNPNPTTPNPTTPDDDDDDVPYCD